MEGMMMYSLFFLALGIAIIAAVISILSTADDGPYRE
jgi:hypothetical protein